MSDEKLNRAGALGEGGYEHEDLSPRGVFYFMAGLVVLGVLIHFTVTGMYRYLDKYDKAHQPPVSPMVTVNPNTRAVTNSDTQGFPQPRLEENERTQLGDVVAAQDKTLATYGWVDEKAGVVRIPIDRAMELVAQRGLPVLPPGATTQPANPKRETGAKPAAKAAAPETR